MTARFSNFALDRYVGPEASTLDEVDIPDMSNEHHQSGYWVVNHFLNITLRERFNPPLNAYAHTYLRRANAAFVEHEAAREATLAFVESDRQAVAKYSLAITHWEYFLGQAWQGYSVLRSMLGELSGERPKLFEKHDGSTEQRLNSLHNAMKHAESRIEDGQIIEGAVSPVWLGKEGLRSTDTLLTYGETADILGDLATWADVLVDPRETADKLRALPADDD